MATDLDFLLLQLNSTKPQEKKKAVAAIEKNACVEAAPALVNILAADRDESLRACAARALGALNYAPAQKSLLGAMESGSDEVCYFASHALAAINSEGCADEIFRMMKDAEGLSEKAFYWYAHTLVKMGGGSLSDRKSVV